MSCKRLIRVRRWSVYCDKMLPEDPSRLGVVFGKQSWKRFNKAEAKHNYPIALVSFINARLITQEDQDRLHASWSYSIDIARVLSTN